MRTTTIAGQLSLAALALLLGCESESHPVAPKLQAMSFANSKWSEPLNLGATINSTFLDAHPNLSKDGLSLYFTSNRPVGGHGGNDLWVARRGCEDCPWEAPVNLGSVINTSGIEAGSDLSVDGHLLFFHSNRPGSLGGNDIYVSWRTDPNDDFGWGPPEALGPDVNTTADENAPAYLQSAEDGSANLYFTRGDATTQGQDLYVAAVTRDGQTRGPAVLAVELNTIVNDAAPTIRADGRELLFHSPRFGTLGFADLWVSTRQSVQEPWSTPVNLGAPLNTTAFEQQPSLSHDGRTLVWASDRPGGSGGLDIWMSTRTPSGH
jgi:WD40 repeat protein